MYSHSKTLYLGLGVLIFLLVSLGGVLYQSRTNTFLSISFLDVGQGDAIFIETPNRKQILIDAGPKDVVMQKLREVMPRGDTSIDLVMITNPDADHINGFVHVLDTYTVGTVIVPNTRNTTDTFKTVMKKIKEKNIPTLVAYKDMQVVIDTDTINQDAILTVLFPDQVVKNWERNNGSIVSQLSYGNTSVMLMGDATSETEKIIVGDFAVKQRMNELESDILKLGHHGSHSSSSEVWLDTVKPQIAIVSAGGNNRYGHPHKEVIDRLHDRDIQVDETSEQGTITYTSDGVGWKKK